MANISVCRSCQRCLRLPMSARSFATTAARADIPPESPDYVYVPKTLQTDYSFPRRAKGVLPVPREVFPKRQPGKIRQAFAERATPSRLRPLDPAVASEEEQNKHRASERRKNHLREGLAELRKRKTRTERQTAARSQVKQEERARLIAQAEREDERLTKSSVLQGMLPTKDQQLADPGLQERHAVSIAKVKALAAQKSEARRDALHALYMTARNFIVDEKALDAEIERVFPDSNDPAFKTSSMEGENIWNLGVPTKMSDLLKKTNAAQDNAARPGVDTVAHRDLMRISAERVKRLAEELSGGRI